jgi:ParB family chromosome partitioning protein
MLDMVDKGQIAMRPAVELSYLPQEEQQILLDVIGSESRTPSHVQATKLRKLSSEGHLDYGTIVSIIKEETPPRAEHFKFPKEKIQHFFPTGTPVQTIEETIIKALELWHKNH